MEQKTDITSLRKKLPRGAAKTIAKRAGVSIQTVRNALYGNHISPKLLSITKIAIEVYTEHQVKKFDVENDVQAVLNETPEQLRERLAFQREKDGEKEVLSN